MVNPWYINRGCYSSFSLDHHVISQWLAKNGLLTIANRRFMAVGLSLITSSMVNNLASARYPINFKSWFATLTIYRYDRKHTPGCIKSVHFAIPTNREADFYMGQFWWIQPALGDTWWWEIRLVLRTSRWIWRWPALERYLERDLSRSWYSLIVYKYSASWFMRWPAAIGLCDTPSTPYHWAALKLHCLLGLEMIQYYKLLLGMMIHGDNSNWRWYFLSWNPNGWLVSTRYNSYWLTSLLNLNPKYPNLNWNPSHI